MKAETRFIVLICLVGMVCACLLWMAGITMIVTHLAELDCAEAGEAAGKPAIYSSHYGCFVRDDWGDWQRIQP